MQSLRVGIRLYSVFTKDVLQGEIITIMLYYISNSTQIFAKHKTFFLQKSIPQTPSVFQSLVWYRRGSHQLRQVEWCRGKTGWTAWSKGMWLRSTPPVGHTVIVRKHNNVYQSQHLLVRPHSYYFTWDSCPVGNKTVEDGKTTKLFNSSWRVLLYCGTIPTAQCSTVT